MLTKVTALLSKLDPLHWILTHLIWIVLVGSIYVGGHMWLQEHDQRTAADAALKASQSTILGLQQQIATTDSQAAQKVQTIVKVVHDAQTPAQVVAALPQFPDLPVLGARTVPGDPVDVEVAAQPLMDLIGRYETVVTNLNACQADFTTQKAIDVQKDTQIAILRKKPKFWHRVGSAAKLIGIGIGIGAIVAGHL